MDMIFLEIEDWKSEKNPCPFFKDECSYCYCGVFDECEFMEEDLNMHNMNHLRLSQALGDSGLRTEYP